MKRRASLPLAVQRLEGRDNPSGNVLVSVSPNGDLIVIGDGSNKGGVGNQIEIYEVGPNQFGVGGDVGTTVNGSVLAPTFNGVTRDVLVTLGAGNDTLEMNIGVPAPTTHFRDVTINMGSGDDIVTLESFFAHNVSVTQPAGDVGSDVTTIQAGQGGFPGQIAGALFVSNSFGQNTTRIQSAILGDLMITNQTGADKVQFLPNNYVGGSLKITDAAGGAGNQFMIQGIIAGNATILNPGADGSSTIIGNAQIGGDVLVQNGTKVGQTAVTGLANTTVGGSVKTIGGMGSDQVGLITSTIAKNFTVQNGDGTNSTLLQLTSGVAGKTMITGGAGDDNVVCENGFSSFGSLTITQGGGTNLATLRDLWVTQTLAVTGGAGTDIAMLGSKGISTAIVSSNASFNLGGGLNSLGVFGVNAQKSTLIGGSLNYTGGASTDLVQLVFASVVGKTTINTGGESDHLYVDHSSFYKPFAANLGGGNDVAQIGTDLTAAGATDFKGNFAVHAGAGSDTVVVGGIDSANTVVNVHAGLDITGADILNVDPNNVHLI